MMKVKNRKLVVVTAGGTGGHVYPADALATELAKRDCEVILYTDTRGLNNYKGKLGEIENKAILSGSVVGKSILTKFVSLTKVALGIVQAMYYLFRKRPDCVVGFGGYASFPTAIAAVILRIPLVIHEQNSVMSRTNRILAKFAVVVAQSFRTVKNTPDGVKTVLSGMPIRKSIASLHNNEYSAKTADDKMVLVILGGSQGAKIFADVVPEAIKMLSDEEKKKLVIYQQCRKGEEKEIEFLYKNVISDVTINSFFENMPELYKKADIIVSRAGASSVYEIAAAGLPSVLVPLSIAADNHQYYNALDFAKNNAALVIEQKDFTIDKMVKILKDFMENPQIMKDMSKAVKELAIVDAAERLADVVEGLN